MKEISNKQNIFKGDLIEKLLLDHPFSMYPKFSEKLTFLSCWHAHVIIVIAIIVTAVVIIIIIIISIIVIIIIIITLLLIYYMLTKNRIQASVSLQRQELNIK